MRFARQQGVDYTIIGNKNVVPRSRYSSFADFKADASAVSAALKNVTNVSPIIYNAEVAGLITLFESLAGKKKYFIV